MQNIPCRFDCLSTVSTAGVNAQQEAYDRAMYQSLSLGHDHKLNGIGGKHHFVVIRLLGRQRLRSLLGY